MNIFLRVVVFLWIITFTTPAIYSQCVALPTLTVINPSFEDSVNNPAFPAHVTPGPWTQCMPGQTPDTQPNNWGVTMPPTHGVSYLGLVHQVSTAWQEGASEALSGPMTAGVPYTFTIDLANSSTTGGGIVPGCAECQIWGGFGPCDDNTGTGELLWSSGDISPMDVWQTYNVSFTPTQNFTWIMIRINSLGCNDPLTDQPYILVDNISPIVPNNVSIITAAVNQNIACPGMNNGQATVHAAGQYLPFTYLWNSTPAQNDSVLDNVPAGTYSVTVTDANTCTATASVTITQPLPITLTPTFNHVTCFGFNTGSAYMSYAGGTEPLTFSWSNGGINTQNNGNLFAGTYGITATDANGCTATASITINQPSQLGISGTATNPTCNTSGSIVTTTTGGTTAYTYSWNTSPVQTTANASNLTGGVYTVTVTDANSCTATATFNLPPVPNIPVVTLTPVSLICFGQNTGSISSSVSGGSPGYTYAWSTTPIQTSPNVTNLAAGTYTLTVTDANTCTASASATISQPVAVSVSIVKTNVLCFGQSTGSATATPAGGTAGYTYSWNTNPVQTTASATNIPAGTYIVTVRDANNCSVTGSTTINQPASALSVSENHVNILCFGGNTGSATATASGGTAGYTYSWNTTPVQTTAAISTLIAGTYAVTVTDSNSCTATVSSVVTQPATPVVVATSLTSPLCFGQPSASAIAIANGGTAGYTYSWNTTPVQNTQAITNIPAGSYTVTATDANSCTATSSITVAPPPTQLTLTSSHVDVLCFGDATGSATVTASGSYGNYSYNWNSTPIQTTAAATQLIAGTYNVTVTDIQGCSATATETVSQPLSPLSISVSKVDVLCFGDATGSATVTASGGTSGYTYSWNTIPVQTTPIASAIVAGTYTVTVTDANNCTATISTVINQPLSPLSVTTVLTSPTCFGQPSAVATATASGGTTGYAYLWNTVPAQNTAVVTNLASGNYTVTVTDANNCTATSAITVPPAPTQLIVTTSHIDVLCFGDATGSVTATATGSYGSYSYSWNTNPVQTTATASQLIAGTYTITVTDIQGCSATAGDVVSQPASALSISTAKVDVLCFGEATGSATVTANGGTAGYNYTWSTTPQQTTPSITSLTAGTYTVTVTDANACSLTGSEVINQPTQLTASFSSANVTCHGISNGTITITAAGGVPAYSYQWSVVPSVNSPNAGGLPPGNYSVTVADVNSCSAVILNMIITEPTALVVNPIITNVSCPGHGDGSIDANPGGGTPGYTFNWSNPPGSTSQIISNLAGGTYAVTVTDANGCITTVSSTVIELPDVVLNGVVTNVLCYPLANGAVDVTASSSFMPLQYQWSNLSATEDISSLSSGTYSVTVTDAHGCTADSVFIVSNDSLFSIDATPDTVTINLGQTVDLNVTAIGSNFGSVIWAPSNGLDCSDCVNPTSSVVESITYFVTGTDVNGCLATDVVHITVIPKYVVFIPNAFTPTGDGNNDFFEVFGNKEAWKQFNVEVFDRWGEKVYESNDMNFKWDGVYKGKLMNPTVLVYQIRIVYLDNYTEKLHKGTVTLIR